MSSSLDTRLPSVVGGRTAQSFEKAFGFRTAGDLLAHYPRRYARRGELTSLTDLPIDENVTIVAEVRSVRERTMRARRGSILEVKISDGTGILTLTFFNQGWRSAELVSGVRGMFAGKVSNYKGALQLSHPDYELFGETDSPDPEAAKRWVEAPIPIYPATGSIASWQIHKAITIVLDGLGAVPDPIPEAVHKRYGLVPFIYALNGIHRPSDDKEKWLARKTLRFHEAFILQVALLQQRLREGATRGTPRLAKRGGLRDVFDAALPFSLTDDQKTVGEEITADMARETPMNRLVQGEVGSGKTLVALRAMLAVADSAGQSALLAPTEVLAAQHFHSIVNVLGPDMAAKLMPVLVTGQQPQAERRKALLRIVSGHARIVVGTHALLSESVSFYDLGLVIIDEQHRFGVEQREALRLKNVTPPHVLVLTATPIPRTVAMTVFGDLDVSTIRQLPTGRVPIESFVVSLAEHPGWEARVWERLAEEVRLGRQGFVVCPAIDSGNVEDVDAKNGTNQFVENKGAGQLAGGLCELSTVAETRALLQAHPALTSTRIEVLHGRLASDEKERIMRLFRQGQIDILVTTTIIEVGVDVPNASTIIVLDADRFGISQLHQLRGRVGRGSVPGLCLLVSRAQPGSVARKRIDAVAATCDGFALAQTDLELRQEGDVLGRVQSGYRSSLRLLRVATDGDIILEARKLAENVLADDPDLTASPILRETIARRLDESSKVFLATG